jgi:hypothetical protein
MEFQGLEPLFSEMRFGTRATAESGSLPPTLTMVPSVRSALISARIRCSTSFMPVPDFQSFFVPVLRQMADGNDHAIAEIRERIAADMKLTPEDLSQKLPSGVQTVFANRIAWSAVYLTKAGALERIIRIAERGRELLGLGLPKLTVKNLSKYPEFLALHNHLAQAR